jgi:hypothetical protein
MSQKLKKEQIFQAIRFERRKFISSALFGGVPALRTPISELNRGALPVKVQDGQSLMQAPKVVDSLSLSTRFLDDVSQSAICVFHETVVASTFSLEQEYQKLLKLVDELESEAPELRGGPVMEKIKEAAKNGAGNTRNINNLANTNVTLIPAFMNVLASVTDANYLLTSASELSQQQSSVTLSPKAANILRMLLREIRGVNSEIQKVSEHAQALSRNSMLVWNGISEIKKRIGNAVSRLADNEYRGASAQRKNEASAQIDMALDKLNDIDKLFSDRLESLPMENRKRCEGLIRNNPPGGFLRDYLSATKALIKDEVRINNNHMESFDRPFMMLKASLNSPQGYLDLSAIIGPILQEVMVENIWIRRWIGAILIRPLLRHRGEARIEKLKQVFPKLLPEGRNDNNKHEIERAAKLLNQILEQHGL